MKEASLNRIPAKNLRNIGQNFKSYHDTVVQALTILSWPEFQPQMQTIEKLLNPNTISTQEYKQIPVTVAHHFTSRAMEQTEYDALSDMKKKKIQAFIQRDLPDRRRLGQLSTDLEHFTESPGTTMEGSWLLKVLPSGRRISNGPFPLSLFPRILLPESASIHTHILTVVRSVASSHEEEKRTQSFEGI